MSSSLENGAGGIAGQPKGSRYADVQRDHEIGRGENCAPVFEASELHPDRRPRHDESRHRTESDVRSGGRQEKTLSSSSYGFSCDLFFCPNLGRLLQNDTMTHIRVLFAKLGDHLMSRCHHDLRSSGWKKAFLKYCPSDRICVSFFKQIIGI